MIRSRFDELRARKTTLEQRRLPLRVISEETGIAIATLHRLSKSTMEGLQMGTINTLCKYFGLTDIGELLEYVPD
jgi:DNA-binding Xre family transcriptional regulator